MAERSVPAAPLRSASDRLGPLPDVVYDRLSDFLERRYGLHFPERRREMLRTHLRRHAESRHVRDWDEYLALLDGREAAAEIRGMVETVTVHQTEFFRHRQLFDAFRKRVFPELVAAAAPVRRPLRIWSAGCSTGEEPYSLAMVALEAGAADVRIVATDIADNVLETARAGQYDRDSMAGVPAELRRRYVVERGDGVEVRPDLRNVIEFKRQNIVADPAPVHEADLVMCCNVTIYFSPEAFERAVERLSGALRPGGYLVLGHAESLWKLPHDLQLIDLDGAFAYRAPDAASAARPAAAAPVQKPATIAPPRPAPARPHRSPQPSAPVASPRPASPRALRAVEVAEVVAAGQGMFERGDLEALDGLVDEALSRGPAVPEFHLLHGMLRQRQGRHDDAIDSFSRAIYCDATCSLAWFYRAAVLELGGDDTRAASDYATAAGCFRRDSSQRWDAFLESMGHAALIRLCEERAAALSGIATGP